MRSLAEAGQSLREKLAARAAEVRARDPRIAQREAELADVRRLAPTMICPTCQGYRFQCDTCGGFGLVCPDCHGMRWVSRGLHVPHRERVIRCQTCTGLDGQYDPEREQIAIGRMFERIKASRRNGR